jgi:hypothetical protein
MLLLYYWWECYFWLLSLLPPLPSPTHPNAYIWSEIHITIKSPSQYLPWRGPGQVGTACGAVPPPPEAIFTRWWEEIWRWSLQSQTSLLRHFAETSRTFQSTFSTGCEAITCTIPLIETPQRVWSYFAKESLFITPVKIRKPAMLRLVCAWLWS